VSSLNGLRLALIAAAVVFFTWRLYRPDPDEPPPAHLHKGAMAAAVILAVLALFNAPVFFGGTVALGDGAGRRRLLDIPLKVELARPND
jgi:hypothetical protein